jgi:imidazole glycerol-phosphate synthase subunit HisH
MNVGADGASPEVLVVPTGAANLASVLSAMKRAGARARVAFDPGEIEDARLVVVPGVGSFGAAMAKLREAGTSGAIATRVRSGGATLGICLGMQIMFEESEESPGVAGLGVLSGKVERFVGARESQGRWRVPQMGWNNVEAGGGGVIEPGAAYFANSYRVAAAPTGWVAATAEHAGRFVAGLEREAVVLCQFHPELSGAWGQAFIRRWIAASLESGRC